MRRDSRIFLTKLLEYREKINEDFFELNCQYFSEIPNIEANLYDIMRDLIDNDCISSTSRVINLEGDIKIFLTSDGITYFNEIEKKREELPTTVWNVYGGQINIANGNGNVESIQNNNIVEHKGYTIGKTDSKIKKNVQRGSTVDECENNETLQENCLKNEHKEPEMALNRSREKKFINIDIINSDLIENNCIKDNVKKDSIKTDNELIEVVGSVQAVNSQKCLKKKKLGPSIWHKLLVLLIIFSISIFVAIKNKYYHITDDIIVDPYTTYISVYDVDVTENIIQRINNLNKVTSITFERCKFEDDVLFELKDNLEEFCMIDCTNVSNYDFLIDMKDLHKIILQNCGVTDDNFPLLEQKGIYSICIAKNEMFTDLSILPLLNLRELDFSDTSVGDIDLLSNCGKLSEINGSSTFVSDISPLAKLEKLNTMYFDHCNIKEIKAEFLSLRMKNVSVEGNGITDCSGFCNFTILENVNLRNNQLNEIAWLEKSKTTLKTVDLSDNQLDNNQISFLVDCTAIEELYLNGIKMSSLNIVIGMKDLKCLEAVCCGLQEISELRGLLKLQWVRLAQNEISDIVVLRELGSSTAKFDLAYNNISNMAYLPTESELLILFGNPISINTNNFSPISGSTVILDYRQGLSDYMVNFEHIYIIDCPMDQRINIEKLLRYPRFVTQEEVIKVLETEKIYYY